MNEKEVRLIDANALLEQTEIICGRYEVHWTDNRVMVWISNAPTIDPERLRPHGKWILGEPDFYGNRKPSCSVCGEYHLSNWTDYARCKCCPNCGAMMEEW